MINQIFDNISKINYKYQDEVMIKSNDNYLTLCLLSPKNDLMVENLLKLCKDDYDFINYTNSKKYNFIITSVTKNYVNYLNSFMNLNIVIDQKYFDIIDKETTLLISAIQHNNIDIAYYLIKDNKSLSNNDLKKYMGSIIYTNYSYKSAFSEIALNENFYSENLNKEKNKFIFQTILSMNLNDFKQNIKMFNKNYIKDTKNIKIGINKKSLKKAFEIFYQHYQKRYIKHLNSKLNDFNIPIDLSSNLFDLFYVVS
jgi:hypothetical protein